jgi:galactokinase/mevalonate kinase-like predicted kinase
MPPRRLVVSAPARANVLGNPTDQYGGSQISCSVDLRARVTLTEAVRTVLSASGAEVAIDGAGDLIPRGDLFDLARAVLSELGPPTPPARIEYASEIPLQSGLAGSTALVVALVRAFLAWQHRTLAPHALAETARAIEWTRMGIVCGFGDQYMATFGGLTYLDFRDKAHGSAAEPPPWATVEPLHGLTPLLPFVLAFTGVRHHSGAVHRPIRERWLAGDPAVVTGYARVAAAAREGKQALLVGDWPRFGALMNENHDVQRGLGGSGESNEKLIAAALAAGALGAKLAGAGDGGTIVALVRPGQEASLERALRAEGAAATWRLAPVPGVIIESDDRLPPAATDDRLPPAATDDRLPPAGNDGPATA